MLDDKVLKNHWKYVIVELSSKTKMLYALIYIFITMYLQRHVKK